MKKAFTTDIEIWMDIALDDLSAARLLYSNGKFRASYFHFQQASEKANKAMAIMSGLLTPEELGDIQHDQLKIYRKSLAKQQLKISEITSVFAIFPKGNEHPLIPSESLAKQTDTLASSISAIDSLANKNLQEISLGELGLITRQISKIKNTEIKLPKNIDKHFDTKFIEVAKWLGQFPTEEAKTAANEYTDFVSNKEESAAVYKQVTMLLSLAIEIGFIEMVFFYCAVLTIKHSSATRYPQGDRNPLNEYTSGLPIIKRQPVFMDLLGEAIEGLRRIHQIPYTNN